MDVESTLNRFEKWVNELDKSPFEQKQLKLKAGIWLNSAVLKIQKPSWLNQTPAANPFGESVFFSIWINTGSIENNRLFYNIHALKLRALTAYSIKSRDFAAAFRLRFKPFENSWPNVSVDFGPLTLMEGWVVLDEENLEKSIADLAGKFLDIQFIIDDLLEERKR